MKNDSYIRVRVPKETKEKAQIAFKKIGIDLSSSVNLFLDYVVKNESLPFDTPKKERFTSLFFDIMNRNHLRYYHIGNNLWIINKKIVVALCIRNIRKNHSRIISINDLNIAMKSMIKISKEDNFIAAICFIWSIEGSDQKCAIIPFDDFVDISEEVTYAERQSLIAYKTVQSNCVDYRLRIRDQDMQWIDEKTNAILELAK